MQEIRGVIILNRVLKINGLLNQQLTTSFLIFCQPNKYQNRPLNDKCYPNQFFAWF